MAGLWADPSVPQASHAEEAAVQDRLPRTSSVAPIRAIPASQHFALFAGHGQTEGREAEKNVAIESIFSDRIYSLERVFYFSN